MGLIDWRLLVRVLVDGEDLSGRFRPLLSAVEVTDAVGLESDAVLIELALGGLRGRMPFPRPGADIEVFLGAGFSAARMGLFIADSCEASGPPDIMTLTARAAVYDGSGGKTGLQDAKTRSWEAGTTVGDLVGQIASEHGLRAAVGQSLQSVALDHVDQMAESDINLLTRLAKDLDAFVKPSGGAIVFARLGESQSAGGQPLPIVRLAGSDLSRWRVSRDSREVSGSCVAVWRDLQAAVDKEVTAGSGEPVERLRHRFTSEVEAQRAADAALARSQRGEYSVSCDLPGRADIMAEGRVQLPALHPDLAGEWLVSSVRHRLDSGGWVTSFDGERPPSA